jgi:hypothetical protein
MNVAALTVNALAAADAEDSALLKEAREIFQPLSMEVEVPSDPALKEHIELGQLLFFDPRLTIDADVSCSSCHQPSRYGTDGLSKSIGVSQRPHPRNAPTVLNAALNFIIHWRGDRESLEDQVVKAITSPITFGQPDERAVLDRLESVALTLGAKGRSDPDLRRRETRIVRLQNERGAWIDVAPSWRVRGGNVKAAPAPERGDYLQQLDRQVAQPLIVDRQDHLNADSSRECHPIFSSCLRLATPVGGPASR